MTEETAETAAATAAATAAGRLTEFLDGMMTPGPATAAAVSIGGDGAIEAADVTFDDDDEGDNDGVRRHILVWKSETCSLRHPTQVKP